MRRTPGATERLFLPNVDPRALRGLKFSEALPERLAVATRLADLNGAATVLTEPVRFAEWRVDAHQPAFSFQA